MAEKRLRLYAVESYTTGRDAMVVAAPSKAAAEKVLQHRRVFAFPEDPGPSWSSVADLAMRTPGVPWQRDQWDWACHDPVLGARAVVLSRFPAATAVKVDRQECGWRVFSGDPGLLLGSNETEDGAWCDAAERISTEPPANLRADAITVWAFCDAPESLRRLSTNGGDEDWLAFVPDSLVGTYIGWLDRGSPFGAYCVDVHPIKGGEVRIGCHG